jgi:hypothetical protein
MNVIMKSLFGGLKETVLPNKINQQAHKARMKEYHSKLKAERKKNR